MYDISLMYGRGCRNCARPSFVEGNFAVMLYRGGDDVSLLWFVLDGRFGGTCPGVGFVFTYRLAYAAGYGLRS